MPTMQELGVFFVIVLGTVALPGLDMAYILARSLAGGARDGLLAVLGIVLGVMVHVIIGVLGVAAILLVVPWAFNLLLCVGAAYLAWIGWTLVRHASAAGHFRVAEARKQSPARIVSMGVATSLSNPKAYLFMLAVFPQFIDPARGSLWAQAGVLWLIALDCQWAVYGSLALAAGRARHWLEGSPRAAVWMFRVVGLVLIAFAFITVIEGMRDWT